MHPPWQTRLMANPSVSVHIPPSRYNIVHANIFHDDERAKCPQHPSADQRRPFFGGDRLLPGVDCWYGEADAALVLEYSEMKFMTV
jgi:hypothetical protein